MRRTCKNLLLSLGVIALLAGCSSKGVSYKTSDNEKTTKAEETNKVDNKVDQIAGEENVSNETNEQAVEDEKLIQVSSSGDYNTVKSDVNGKTVVLESVHFAFDKFNLTDDMREISTSNANKITTVSGDYSNLKIKVEGNCDEWGTDEYNYALGLKRAKTVKDALVTDGISADKIVMVSFGESNPVCKEKNVKCWKLNRRVDYRLLP